MKNLKSRAEQETQKVLARLEKIVQSQGETVDQTLHDDFAIMEENNDGICEFIPRRQFQAFVLGATTQSCRQQGPT